MTKQPTSLIDHDACQTKGAPVRQARPGAGTFVDAIDKTDPVAAIGFCPV